MVDDDDKISSGSGSFSTETKVVLFNYHFSAQASSSKLNWKVWVMTTKERKLGSEVIISSFLAIKVGEIWIVCGGKKKWRRDFVRTVIVKQTAFKIGKVGGKASKNVFL